MVSADATGAFSHGYSGSSAGLLGSVVGGSSVSMEREASFGTKHKLVVRVIQNRVIPNLSADALVPVAHVVQQVALGAGSLIRNDQSIGSLSLKPFQLSFPFRECLDLVGTERMYIQADHSVFTTVRDVTANDPRLAEVANPVFLVENRDVQRLAPTFRTM